MIAEFLQYPFIIAAALPLLSILASSKIPHLKLAFYRPIFWGTVLFFCWELFRSQYLIRNLEYWLYVDRFIDPFFISALVFYSFFRDDESLSSKASGFNKAIKVLAGVMLLNIIIQILTLQNAPSYNFISGLFVFGLIWILEKFYSKFSSYPRVRYRMVFYLWFISALIPLAVGRVFYLIIVSYVFYRMIQECFRENKKKIDSLLTEKRVVGSLMEELTGKIKDVSDLKGSLEQFLKGLLKAVEGKAAAVYLYNPKTDSFYAERVEGYFFPLHRKSDNIFTRLQSLHQTVYSLEYQEAGQLVYDCGKLKQEIFIPYASGDSRMGTSGTGNIQSLILEPLLLEKDTLGVLVVQNKSYERYFSDSDVSVVRNFSHHAAMMINSAHLLEEKSERQRVDTELSLGYKIQADLLPDKIPEYPGINVRGTMIPAKEIGGDYYDFIEMDEYNLGIVIGDVSGKGVAAGMIMSIVQTLLHAQYPYHTNTRDLLISVNTALAEKIKAYMFMTLLFFKYNSKERSLKYSSCGHEHILHYRKAEGRLECTKSGGLALGMTEDNSPYVVEKEIQVADGDCIVLYTDGIVEARAKDGEMYGLENLKKFVEAHHGLSAELLRDSLVDHVKTFTRGAPQSDDITCLVMSF
jgi:serine phosphatase RsbU (regulator of sigma subunit)